MVPRRALLGLVLGLVLALPAVISAQGREASIPAGQAATLAGLVTAEGSGTPLQGVVVALAGTGATTVTDARGAYTLTVGRGGGYQLSARKMGFGPLDAAVQLVTGRQSDVDLELLPVTSAQLLPGLDVRAAHRASIIAEVEARRAAGQGTMILRGALDSARGTPVSELLRKHVRGIHLIYYSRSGATLVASARGSGSLNLTAPADPADRTSPGACYAQIYLDGMRIYAPVQPFSVVPDLRQIDAATLETMEYYAGPATTPLQYAGVGAQCGTILLWSRAGE